MAKLTFFSISCQALWEGRRLDGRGWMDTRDLSVSFGSDWGSCQVLRHFKNDVGITRKSLSNHINCNQVTLGKTRVLAQVSATVTEPRLSRLTFLDCGSGVLF